MTKRPAIERFMEKVNRTDAGCMEWSGGTNGAGYGMFFVDWAGGGNRKELAHRWSYTHHVGPIPVGLQLDHLCRNPICVNPEHLEPVTQRENILRSESVAAIHARKTECINGHALTGRNLILRSNGRWRDCRECKRQRDRRNRARKAA